MKNLSKLFLIILLATVSTIAKAQVFTAAEFVGLTYKSQDDLKTALESKGYTFVNTQKGDLSENLIYSSNEMKVSVITPTFENGETLISWEFTGNRNVYRDLTNELSSLGFKKIESERRSDGRYESGSYQKPGVTVTLSNDRTENSDGIYTMAVRYSNAAWANL